MINPRAYLTTVKNVRRGLETRSMLIEALEREVLSAAEISKRTGIPLHRVRYHLRMLKKDRVVVKVGKGRNAKWRLTGMGQTSLDETTR
ncbi:MAG: winged helix-turn-helix domain-containing protein [Candidatus Caldarchaeum sp.]|uniref:ArsR family transcriptional regulator n=1 Tax=Caldiarchaeum subterraneum TaxID=311458 RepID=A0A7C5U5N9_CALS0